MSPRSAARWRVRARPIARAVLALAAIGSLCGPSSAGAQNLHASIGGVSVEQQQALLDSNKISRIIGQIPDKSSGATTTPVGLDITDAVSLGVYLRRPDAISWEFLMPVKVSAGAKSASGLVAGSVSAVLIGHKVLMTYVYAVVKSRADVEWVRVEAADGLDRIAAANRTARQAVSTGRSGPDPPPPSMMRAQRARAGPGSDATETLTRSTTPSRSLRPGS